MFYVFAVYIYIIADSSKVPQSNFALITDVGKQGGSMYMLDLAREITVLLPIVLEDNVTYIQMSNHIVYWSEGYRIKSFNLISRETKEIYEDEGNKLNAIM